MSIVTRALLLATAAHEGQKRKIFALHEEAEDYIWHPIRVAEQLPRRHMVLRAAALLHDVVEDTDHTLADIRLHAGDDVAALVKILTKAPDEKYFDYIQRVAGNADAAAIKQADIWDNLRDLPEKHSLRKRYFKARAILDGLL